MHDGERSPFLSSHTIHAHASSFLFSRGHEQEEPTTQPCFLNVVVTRKQQSNLIEIYCTALLLSLCKHAANTNSRSDFYLCIFCTGLSHPGAAVAASVVTRKQTRIPNLTSIYLYFAQASLTLEELSQRVAQFTSAGLPLLVTRLPLFTQKAEMVPGSTFVVGYDTAARLLMSRYYGGHTQVSHSSVNLGHMPRLIESLGCLGMPLN